ncbi:MAG: sigma-70 family RNA polymerase sigma factor [Bryobacteraceae bacterium]
MTAAREQILALLRERILAYAASHIGRDSAEDLVQEVLLLLETKYGDRERLEDLLPLSFQILRYKIADWRRKGSRRGEFNSVDAAELALSDGRPDAESLVARRQLEERVAAALSQLEGRCRDIFRMKLEGRTFEQIRQALGAATVNTVYTWDFRCRKAILEKMGGKWQ